MDRQTQFLQVLGVRLPSQFYHLRGVYDKKVLRTGTSGSCVSERGEKQPVR